MKVGAASCPAGHPIRARAAAAGARLGRYAPVVRDAERFPAWTAWSGLTDEERRAVERLAKRGRQHPDQRVAEAARAWAEVLVVDEDFWKEDRWWRRVFSLPDLLLWGDGGFTDWLEHRSEQRWARRVLRARPGGG